jgi:SAM-dependent methyltransferase
MDPLLDPLQETDDKYGLTAGIPFPGSYFIHSVGSPSLESFLVVGHVWSQIIERHIEVRSRLLDIGCGCGRTARFLASNAMVRRYVGFDVVDFNIDWCRKHIERNTQHRFRFVHADIYNGLYNPKGSLRAAEYSFPVESASIDIAFAASVFTHLLEPDARRYLDETARVLAPGGLLIASIHDQGVGNLQFTGDEHRIDICPSYFAAMVATSGLSVQCDRGHVLGQRMMIFQKS